MNPSLTELTTAASDAALGALCGTLMWQLRKLPAEARWQTGVWNWVFVLLLVASVLGAVAHGFDLSSRVRAGLWQPLYLSLGLAVALFVVGAVADWRGEGAAKTFPPWAVGMGIAFFAISRLAGGSFVLFIAYEGAAMVAALVIYTALAVGRGLSGAATVSVGIALTIAAALVQLSDWHVRLIVPFDRNGLFHLVQMPAVLVLARGIRQSLVVTPPGTDPRRAGTRPGTRPRHQRRTARR